MIRRTAPIWLAVLIVASFATESSGSTRFDLTPKSHPADSTVDGNFLFSVVESKSGSFEVWRLNMVTGHRSVIHSLVHHSGESGPQIDAFGGKVYLASRLKIDGDEFSTLESKVEQIATDSSPLQTLLSREQFRMSKTGVECGEELTNVTDRDDGFAIHSFARENIETKGEGCGALTRGSDRFYSVIRFFSSNGVLERNEVLEWWNSQEQPQLFTDRDAVFQVGHSGWRVTDLKTRRARFVRSAFERDFGVTAAVLGNGHQVAALVNAKGTNLNNKFALKLYPNPLKTPFSKTIARFRHNAATIRFCGRRLLYIDRTGRRLISFDTRKGNRKNVASSGKNGFFDFRCDRYGAVTWDTGKHGYADDSKVQYARFR